MLEIPEPPLIGVNLNKFVLVNKQKCTKELSIKCLLKFDGYRK